MLPREPGVVGDLDRLAARALAQRDHSEGAGRGEGIGQKIEEHRAGPAHAAGDQADQHVADVGDRRVGEHPLQVRLRERDDVSDRHRDRRDHPEQRRPVGRHAAQGHREHADQGREGAGLGPGRDQRRHARRRALIHVGHPHVKRHRGDLEAEPDHQEPEAGDEQRVTWSGSDRRRDPVQVRRAGGAVDERDAVEQERRGERAEEEIFHRRLARGELPLEHARQDVERERHQLEGQEHDDQVAGGGQQHHAGRREEHQRPVLARLGAGAAQVVHREQHDEGAGVADDHVEEQREVVEHDHVAERAPRRAPPRERRQERPDHAGERDHRRQLARQRARNDVEHQHDCGGGQHDQGRHQRTEEDGREDDGVHG